MNQQLTKRPNPFDVPKNIKPVVEEEVAVEENEDLVEYVEEPVVVKPIVKQQTTPRQPKVVQRQQYYQPDDLNREKYTSTMDIALRRQIKIVCATRGVMFAKFVEDACREKLAREGVR